MPQGTSVWLVQTTIPLKSVHKADTVQKVLIHHLSVHLEHSLTQQDYQMRQNVQYALLVISVRQVESLKYRALVQQDIIAQKGQL